MSISELPSVAMSVSYAMRDFLIEHMNGPRPCVAIERPMRIAMLRRGWIRHSTSERPRFTYLTKNGTYIACALASYEADRLSRGDLPFRCRPMTPDNAPWLVMLAKQQMGIK